MKGLPFSSWELFFLKSESNVWWPNIICLASTAVWIPKFNGSFNHWKHWKLYVGFLHLFQSQIQALSKHFQTENSSFSRGKLHIVCIKQKLLCYWQTKCLVTALDKVWQRETTSDIFQNVSPVASYNLADSTLNSPLVTRQITPVSIRMKAQAWLQ